MPLPIPNLDDRRFDDLVDEARARLGNHLPELTHIAPGDPAHSFIDLFAWLTESMLFRANLIPERQRRVVMNLLQIPIRAATASRGVVCIDAGPRSLHLPSLLTDGTQLKGRSGQSYTTVGELQATPLSMNVSIKQLLGPDELSAMNLSLEDLRQQYGLAWNETPEAFKPRHFQPGKEVLSLAASLDQAYYLALLAPKPLQDQLSELRQNLAGIILNMAIAPADELDGEEVSALAPRQLQWELMSEDETGKPLSLPLEVLDDSSRGARRAGVVRLRLPKQPALFKSLASEDPMFAGVGAGPPELPSQLPGERVALWLRLRCEDEPELPLSYLGVNGIDVLGQGRKQDLMLGIGNGRPDQIVVLPDNNIDPDSLELEVEEDGRWLRWQGVEALLGQREGARVYRLDAASGYVYFGDGLEGGRRPPAGMRIRAASYRHGGGLPSNAEAGEIKELLGSARLTVRQEAPLKGGVDAETVDQAERRIPQFLTHRNRAVTEADFQLLARHNPVNPVARAEVMRGFLPGASLQAARQNVPGVISVFLLPPRQPPVLRQTPKPSKGLLKDVFEYLLQRLLVGTELYVLSPEFLPLAIGVRVSVMDRQTEQETLRAVQTALVELLWPLAPGGLQGEGWPMGGAVSSAELFTRIARVSGVRSVNALRLYQRGEEGWYPMADNAVIPLQAYQLPELLGLSVGTGTGEPDFPAGIGGLAGSGGEGDERKKVPAPVIPDFC